MPAPNNTGRRAHAGGQDITQYLKAPKPGSWLILLLTLVVLAMVLTWSLVGTMKTTVAVTGIKSEAHFTGYLRPADSLSLEAGMPVEYEGEQAGILTGRDTAAYSAQEIAEALDNAYFASQLNLNEHNVAITADVDPASCPDGVVTLEIVTTEIRPFDFFMG